MVRGVAMDWIGGCGVEKERERQMERWKHKKDENGYVCVNVMREAVKMHMKDADLMMGKATIHPYGGSTVTTDML